MADCEVEGAIASPRDIPPERAMSPTGERSNEGRNIRSKQNPLGTQERQTRIGRANVVGESLTIYLFIFSGGSNSSIRGIGARVANPRSAGRVHGNEQAKKWPKRLPRCIHLVYRFLLEIPSDKFWQKRISTLTELAVGKFWSRLHDVP
ncbi:hypothetical protein TNCV_963171 [Trichonephila clavipes]|nr:hypothetical protein TNCV_963171 [Trichonephila clavipes]